MSNRVAIITDTHFGAGNDSEVLFNYFEKFYTGTFFPSIDEEKIDTLLMLGDTFDRRRFGNYQTIHKAKEIFFNPLKERGINVFMVIGNHDCYFKNTNKVNSPRLVLSEYDNITIIEKPSTIDVNGTDVCFIPWIPEDEESQAEAKNELKTTSSKLCMGHLEVAGFAMWRNKEGEEGETPRELFNKFDMTFSGHYHHKNDDGKVFYLGNPYEMTWNDYDDPRGFHYFDLQTHELEFVENPNKLFRKVVYDGETVPDLDSDELKDARVKLIVKNKDNIMKYEKFFKKLESMDHCDLKVEDVTVLNVDDINLQDTIEIGDSLQIIGKYIDKIESYDKNKKSDLKNFMKNLYTDAMEKEVL